MLLITAKTSKNSNNQIRVGQILSQPLNPVLLILKVIIQGIVYIIIGFNMSASVGEYIL